jgi:hypothetical protein
MKIKLTGTDLLVGIALTLLTPVLLPAITAFVKPVAKGIIKGGLILVENTKVLIAESKEKFLDLGAETKSGFVKLVEEAKSELSS